MPARLEYLGEQALPDGQPSACHQDRHECHPQPLLGDLVAHEPVTVRHRRLAPELECAVELSQRARAAHR